MTRVDWSALSEALLHVERLNDDASGLLSFGASDTGGVFVERGRVCFIAAKGHGQRLHDVLLRSSNAAPHQLDRVREQCRAENKWVGQKLLAEGLLSASELEGALRRHSAECLLELCKKPLPTRWAAHVGGGFAARFTFRPVDLLFDAVGLQFPEQRASARATLQKLAAPGRRAAAFLFDSARDALLPIAELGGQGVAALTALAEWAAAFPRASLELGAEPCFTLAATNEGQAVLVWWRAGLLFTVLCEDRAALAAATALHLAGA